MLMSLFFMIIFTFVEVQVLQSNQEFISLISNINMPTMRRGYIQLYGFSK